MHDNKEKLIDPESNYSTVKKVASHGGHFDITKEDLM